MRNDDWIGTENPSVRDFREWATHRREEATHGREEATHGREEAPHRREEAPHRRRDIAATATNF